MSGGEGGVGDRRERLLMRLYRGSVFALLLLVLLPGYARAVIHGSVINVQAWVSVALLLLLGAHFAMRHGKSVRITFLILLFTGGAFLGWLNGGTADSIVSHAFIFSPFIIAFLLLELDIGGSLETVLFWLTVCGAAGAITANFIHVFHPELLASLLKEEDNLDVVINLGRVAWAGYIVALPIVAQLGFMDIHPTWRRRMVFVGILIVLAGAFLTFNRTLTVALVLLLAYLFYVKRRDLGLKGIAMFCLLVASGSSFIGWWARVNPGLLDLIDSRVVSFLSGSQDVSLDVSIRMTLYGEYVDRIKRSFMLGQGIGVPVSRLLGDATWADVTLITFVVPFGIFGLCMFAVFLQRLHARIKCRSNDLRVRRLFLLILFLGLGISLNDDVWSHKFFVVYFVYVVNSLRPPLAALGDGPGAEDSLDARAQPAPGMGMA